MENSQRRHDAHHHSWPPKLTTDLMMNIFYSLPLKSIAFCSCVSKQWESVLSHQSFKDLRFTKSQARPRLVFACKREEENKIFFLTAPEPQSLEEMVSPITDYHHMTFFFDYPTINIDIYPSVGLYMMDESVICNPSTGQSLRLQKKEEKGGRIMRFLGFEPVEKLHKVLSVICHYKERTLEYQVLTLEGGTEKATSWRKTECGIPCDESRHKHHICINGILYFTMTVAGCGRLDDDLMLICFDFKSEKFSFLKFPERYVYPNLIDYNGKLALQASFFLDGGNVNVDFELWVLQNPERHEWSHLFYPLPPMWEDVCDPVWLEIVGATGQNEFVLVPSHSDDPFHVFFCNFEKKTVTRVLIQGMGARRCRVSTYLNHVEDMKVMEL